MIKIVDINLETIENAGCNNGNYPGFAVLFDDDSVAGGSTCRCGNGCSDTDKLPVIGMEFASLDEYYDWQAGVIQI